MFLALGLPALFAPAAGHLADRIRRRPLLLWANALTAGLVLSLLAVRSQAEMWIIYLVAFGSGVAFTVLGSAGAGLQKDLLPEADLAAANAALSSIGYGVRIAAPLAGAGIFTAFGGGAVAVLDAATFAAAIAALLSIRVTESAPQPAPPGSFRREVSAGFRHLRAATYLSGSVALVLAGAVVDGLGLVWLVAVSGAAIQRFSPPRLQGRANAAWTMAVITPQTVSIAAGAALISYVSYRVLLLAVIAAIGGCAAYLLVRPAPEPSGDAPGGQGRAASTARCSDTSVSSRSGRASVLPARTMDRTSSVVAPESARKAS